MEKGFLVSLAVTAITTLVFEVSDTKVSTNIIAKTS